MTSAGLALVLKLVIGAIVSIVALALILVLAFPPPAPAPEKGLDFSGAIARGDVPDPKIVSTSMRDGAALQSRVFPSTAAEAPLLVLLHGSGWYGRQFNGLGARVAKAGLAHVLAPDLRGHGPQAARRGDVDYIGQLEDDIADLIAAHRQDGQKVILGGHSSGGGLVLRLAGGAHRDAIDAALLLAPYVQHDAPTQRRNAGGWSSVSVPRLIGLSILNAARVPWLNHLAVIRFNFPKTVRSGPFAAHITDSYSYRLNTSYGPRRDYLRDIKALPRFLLIAGAEDEAFDAGAYEPMMASVTDAGQFRIVSDAGHLDLVDHDTSFEEIAVFLRRIAEH